MLGITVHAWHNRKGDAYSHMVWSIGECEQSLKTLRLYGGNCFSSDPIEQNKTAWAECKKKATLLFFNGGKYCQEGERYHPALNNDICKHFVQECIQRVLETIHIKHEQKIVAVGLMFAAWFQPKES